MSDMSREINENPEEAASLRRAMEQTRLGQVRWLDDDETIESAVSSPTPDSSNGERCAECGGANIVWFTDSALWNEVMGRDRSPILCPQCFVAKAEGLQRPTAWSLQPEARPSPTPDEQAAEGRSDVGTEFVQQVEAFERGDLDEPLAEWENTIRSADHLGGNVNRTLHRPWDAEAAAERERYNRPAGRPEADFAVLEAFHRIDCIGGAERAHDNCWDAIDAVRAALGASIDSAGPTDLPALVVVREQLTQARALLANSASALHVALAYAEGLLPPDETREDDIQGCFIVLALLREATNPPSPPTYTTEEGQDARQS